MNNTMTTEELDRLEALARAATRGPWIFTKYGSVMDGEKIFEIVPADTMYEDRLFIAAANPAAILELITLARRAAPPIDLNKTRAEFEAWAEGAGFDLRRAPVSRNATYRNEYYEDETCGAWLGWMGALARTGSAAPTAAEGPSEQDALWLKDADLWNMWHQSQAEHPRSNNAVRSFARKIIVATIEQSIRETSLRAPLPTKEGVGELDAMSQAARDVLAERRRQIEAEGWTPEHDDMHSDGQMAAAAGYYALACAYPHERDIGGGHVPTYWPWAPSWWKPRDVRSNLVRAGALILAEVERLDRAAQPKDTTDTKEKTNG